MLKNEPMPLSQENWRSRWLVDAKWDMLHRVSKDFLWGNPGESQEDIPEEDQTSSEQLAEFRKYTEEEKIEGVGYAICGQSGFMRMPGIFSRMGLPRCPECCKLMNVSEGKGNPFNDGFYEDGDVPKEQPEPTSDGSTTEQP